MLAPASYKNQIIKNFGVKKIPLKPLKEVYTFFELKHFPWEIVFHLVFKI